MLSKLADMAAFDFGLWIASLAMKTKKSARKKPI